MVKWIGLTLATVIAATLLWGVGELHYRNCVNAAKAAGSNSQAETILRKYGLDRGSTATVAERIQGCSRLPF